MRISLLKILLTTFLFLIVIVGCGNREADEKTKPSKQEQPKTSQSAGGESLKIDKADSLVVDSINGTAIYGKIEFAVIEGGPGLATDNPEPAGPITVLIIRNISDKDLEKAKQKGLQSGCAYLVTKDKQFKFIRRIDTALSDKAIAAQFGIQTK